MQINNNGIQMIYIYICIIVYIVCKAYYGKYIYIYIVMYISIDTNYIRIVGIINI